MNKSMHKLFLVNFILLICCAVGIAETQHVSLHHKLQEDMGSGAITRAEYLAYQLLAIQNSPELPQRYEPLNIEYERHATGLVAEAVSLLPTLPDNQQQLLKQALSRPSNLPLSIVSPSGRFRLHYTDSGYDAADEAFLLESAKAYDDAYELIVEELGYPVPPVDPVAGPEWDVYVSNLGNYGYSTPENAAPTERYPHGVTSFIQMDNDFNSTYTKGLDGMRVTAAHEFFHTVQLGMRNFPSTKLDSRWLYEATATWMEDVAYESVNDYLQYLPHYFSTLHRPFYTFNGLHEYGLSIFFHMLEEKYGADIVRRLWEEFAIQEQFEALENVLRSQGSSFAMELTDHMVWNYFTGMRADTTQFYPEGRAYPLVEPHANIYIEKTAGVADEAALLGAKYINVQPDGFGTLTLTPDFPKPQEWMYAVVNQPLGREAQVYTTSGSRNLVLPQVSPTNTIYLMPVCITVPTSDATNVTEELEFLLTLGDVSNFEPKIQAVFPNPFRPPEHPQGLRIDVRLTEKTQEMTLIVLKENGQEVFREFMPFESEQYGDLSVYWDGRSSAGDLVSSGVYLIYIQAGQEIKPAKVALIR